MAKHRFFSAIKRWLASNGLGWPHPLVVPAMVLFILLLGSLAWQFRIMVDTTHNQRNTLSSASLAALQQLSGPVEVTAFCSNSPYKGRYFRKSISALLQRYETVYADLHMQFIDPATAPTLARTQQIKKEGEMIIRYRGQEKRMYLPYTEQAFTNVLLQLQHGERAPLWFMAGHGETVLEDTTTHGGSVLAQAMHNAGLRFNSAHTLPALAQQDHMRPTLVLAGASSAYPADQVTEITHHVALGGNLIWLVDTAQTQGLQTLTDTLGIEISAGMVIDPGNRAFDIPLHSLSTQHYAAQGPTEDFALRTFFEQAHAIQRNRQPNDAWHTLPLVAAATQGWTSKHYRPGASATQIQFDANQDVQGPATIMLALEKTLKTGERQRILVIGSRQFFSNQQIQRGGNLALTLQSLKWVVNNQPSIHVPVTPLRDSVVALPTNQTGLILLFNSFQFGLPALLIWAGWLRWRRKQRA
ncbi:DUF4350 domain-containing protein [Methylophilus medardicus]|uniref:Uncharacterized protein n=1 Tax=Methylophilus medardicus TaxID=2588534 RepID=A0A5B8CTQ1_9PROT|nr:DUF4350 domain-containing protein [Methylophilus medardicus]QDC44671.1 hypothetical protein FIU01_09100 [Methylophilus medardicus]QDC49678.1 hypothetical protein FIU00_09100 [Methylophilus medardicus]QDC53383.1 hypothetical protein FIT99_09100 [Methylophilus medardicus]